MAQQDNIFTVKGGIGNVSFFKSRNGYQVRRKGGITAERLRTDPAFARTRDNLAEFGRAGKAGFVLRTALKSVIKGIADSRISNRLTREMMRVIKADPINDRGQRTAADGDITLLEGFDCNLGGLLETVLSADYTATIDRATGELKVEMPPFVPTRALVAPFGTTHFVIKSAGAAVDFGQEICETDFNDSALLPLNRTATAAITLKNSVTAASTHPLLLVFGIQFFEEVNNSMNALGASAMKFVKVSVV